MPDEIPEVARARIELQLAEVRRSLAVLRTRLAGIPRSERRTTDQVDLERLEEREGQLEEEHARLERIGDAVKRFRRVTFVNREHELAELSRPTRPQYVILEAPAGYGKTFLFKKLQRVITDESPGTVCLYVPIPRGVASDDELVFLDADEQIICQGKLGSEVLIRRLVSSLTAPGVIEVTLLFDSMELLADTGTVTETFWQDLVLVLERRLGNVVQFRAMFSGRRVRSTWQGSLRHRLQVPIQLEPFHERAVIEAIHHFVTTEQHRRLTNEHVAHIAREIVEITGGHPRAILGIVEEFASYGFAVDLDRESSGYAFSPSALARIADLHLTPALDEVFASVDSGVSHAMQTLSVFRGFNVNILRTLIDRGFIAWSDSPTDLLGVLARGTWLVSPCIDDLLYRDAIVRLISASKMRIVNPVRYLQLSELALDLFEAWVIGTDLEGAPLAHRPTGSLQLRFAIEAIYHKTDMHRFGPPDANLGAKLAAFTWNLTPHIVPTFVDVEDLITQFWEMLWGDHEFWSLLSRVGGDAAVNAYLLHARIP